MIDSISSLNISIDRMGKHNHIMKTLRLGQKKKSISFNITKKILIIYIIYIEILY